MNALRSHAAVATACALAVLLSATVTSSGRGADSEKPVPSKDRAALERTLERAFRALPSTTKKFRRDRSGDDRHVGATAPSAASIGGWGEPATARATRAYLRRAAGNDDEATLEINVILNAEGSLPDALASEGGALRVTSRDHAPIARLSLAGIGQGRVALPLDAEAEAHALTVVRIFVAAAEHEGYLDEIARGNRPDQSPWANRVVARPSAIRSIVIEYRGPADEVDRLASATSIGSLRALLTP